MVTVSTGFYCVLCHILPDLNTFYTEYGKLSKQIGKIPDQGNEILGLFFKRQKQRQ